MKILLVEDHSIVRYGVVRILTEMSPDILIDESEDLDEALKQIAKTKYDLIILDINVPHGGNIEMIRLIRLKQPGIKILVFSGADEKIYALRCLREGADGYVMKDSPNQDIVDAVRSIMNNEKYVSANIRQQLLHNLNQKEQIAANPMMGLSNREIEVMELLIHGHSIGEIAKTMNLHVSTVSTYKMRIFKKFEVKNVIDLAEKRKLL
jgi:DNA-binding NarL/FixJ family response regulator